MLCANACSGQMLCAKDRSLDRFWFFAYLLSGIFLFPSGTRKNINKPVQNWSTILIHGEQNEFKKINHDEIYRHSFFLERTPK